MSSTKISMHDLDLEEIQVVLLSSSWTGSAIPYTQPISVGGATETNMIICSPNPEKANMELIGDCKVVLTKQEKGICTFTAFDGLPSGDITFNLLVGGEG